MPDFRNFKDFNYINALIMNSLEKIPTNIDIIVGIPRSGLIVSTLIAEYIGKPSTDLQSYIFGHDNIRMAKSSVAPETHIAEQKNVLLVDDGLGSGVSMQNAKNMILEHKPDTKITTLSIFVEPFATNKCDIYFQVMRDQFMPWSVLKRGIEMGCCDIDGVLTEDVPHEYDDDGEKYINFLKNQRPKFRPDRKINTLVTGRLEKYRGITEDWLRQHNVQYGQLIMCQCKNNAERAQQDMGRFKAEVFKRSGLPLFIESDFREAGVIKSLCPDKSVFCVRIANYME